MGTEMFEMSVGELPEILRRLDQDEGRALSERLALAIGEHVDIHHRRDGALRQLRDGVVVTDPRKRRIISAKLVGDVLQVQIQPFQS